MSIIVLDVSNIIYGGYEGQDKKLKGFPIGGLYKLFGIIHSEILVNNIILCFTGDKILKNQLLPEYKNKIPDFSVYAQIEFAKELLEKCNIPYYYDERYEAIDFISTIVYKLHTLDSTASITIYSDDLNLSFCIAPNVSVRNLTSVGKCINIDNYSYRVVPKKTILYNTILIYKLFYGDFSNNYKGIQLKNLDYDSLSKIIIDNISPLIESEKGFSSLDYCNYEVFCFIIDNITFLSQSDKNLLKENAKFLYPCFIDFNWNDFSLLYNSVRAGFPFSQILYTEFKTATKTSFNRKAFYSICNTLGLTSKGSLDSDLLELLSLRAKELRNGDFLASKVSGKKIEYNFSSNIINMDLPNE